MRWRGPALLGLLWVVAAVAATAVGLVAVRLVSGDLGGSVAAPLSPDGVRSALVTPTGATPTRTLASPGPSRTPAATRTPRPVPTQSQPGTSAEPRSPRPAATGPLRTFRTSGGVVGARCVGGAPDLVYATPADGWRTDEARDDRVRFRRDGDDGGQEVEIRLSCSGSTAQAAVEQD